MKRIIFIFFLLSGLAACKKESLTDVMKGDNSTIINQLSTSWELDYKDSYFTLDIALGDVMVLYRDSKCTRYTPGDTAAVTNQIWALNSSLYSINLPCIKGTALTDYDWNIDDLTDHELWLSKSVNSKNLILRFSKK